MNETFLKRRTLRLGQPPVTSPGQTCLFIVDASTYTWNRHSNNRATSRKGGYEPRGRGRRGRSGVEIGAKTQASLLRGPVRWVIETKLNNQHMKPDWEYARYHVIRFIKS